MKRFTICLLAFFILFIGISCKKSSEKKSDIMLAEEALREVLKKQGENQESSMVNATLYPEKSQLELFVSNRQLTPSETRQSKLNRIMDIFLFDNGYICHKKRSSDLGFTCLPCKQFTDNIKSSYEYELKNGTGLNYKQLAKDMRNEYLFYFNFCKKSMTDHRKSGR